MFAKFHKSMLSNILLIISELQDLFNLTNIKDSYFSFKCESVLINLSFWIFILTGSSLEYLEEEISDIFCSFGNLKFKSNF